MDQGTGTPRDATVELFERDFQHATKLSISKRSKIKLVDAYVEDTTGLPALRTAPWLHVRIDGKEGWISNPADLKKIGLPYIPRVE